MIIYMKYFLFSKWHYFAQIQMSFIGGSAFDVKKTQNAHLWQNPPAENLCLWSTLSDQTQSRFIKITVAALAQQVKELDVLISC